MPPGCVALQAVERPSVDEFAGGTAAHDDPGAEDGRVGEETEGMPFTEIGDELGYHPATIAKMPLVWMKRRSTSTTHAPSTLAAAGRKKGHGL